MRLVRGDGQFCDAAASGGSLDSRLRRNDSDAPSGQMPWPVRGLREHSCTRSLARWAVNDRHSFRAIALAAFYRNLWLVFKGKSWTQFFAEKDGARGQKERLTSIGSRRIWH
jgi:hypothetical protein